MSILQELESRIEYLLRKRDYLIEEGNKEAFNECVEDIVVLDWIKEIINR